MGPSDPKWGCRLTQVELYNIRKTIVCMHVCHIDIYISPLKLHYELPSWHTVFHAKKWALFNLFLSGSAKWRLSDWLWSMYAPRSAAILIIVFWDISQTVLYSCFTWSGMPSIFYTSNIRTRFPFSSVSATTFDTGYLQCRDTDWWMLYLPLDTK